MPFPPKPSVSHRRWREVLKSYQLRPVKPLALAMGIQGAFLELVKHKAEWAGVTVMQVDPRKTSQMCSACGLEGDHKDLCVRTHVCEHCGVVLDRDHNAALNILDRGLGRSPRETVTMGTFRGTSA